MALFSLRASSLESSGPYGMIAIMEGKVDVLVKIGMLGILCPTYMAHFSQNYQRWTYSTPIHRLIAFNACEAGIHDASN